MPFHSYPCPYYHSRSINLPVSELADSSCALCVLIHLPLFCCSPTEAPTDNLLLLKPPVSCLDYFVTQFTAKMPHQEITRDEVAKHNTEDSLWCIIDHKVYDLTDFVDAHPGGSVVLAQVAGTDATAAFYNLHRHEVLQKYDAQLCVGVLAGETPEVVDPQPGDLSQVPYAEPLWLRPQFHSPYYAESHRRLQRAVRLFTDTHVTPEAQEKERDGTYISQALIDKMAEANLLAMKLGPGPHLHGRQLLGGAVDGKDFDYFHDLVVAQESVRPKARGFQDGNMAGMMISLTAVRQWLGDKALQAKVTDECLSGKKKICLAITEAFAGTWAWGACPLQLTLFV